MVCSSVNDNNEYNKYWKHGGPHSTKIIKKWHKAYKACEKKQIIRVILKLID